MAIRWYGSQRTNVYFIVELLIFHLKVIFVFSWIYIRYYQDHYESEMSTTITAIVALTITLITSAMVPFDIFIVSYMKNSDGSFKVIEFI